MAVLSFSYITGNVNSDPHQTVRYGQIRANLDVNVLKLILPPGRIRANKGELVCGQYHCIETNE